MNSKNSSHITIALCVFNGEDTIEQSVRALLNQSYQNLDLYVVNDASEDRTEAIVQDILPEDSRLHLISLEKNVGTYACKNLVLANYCKGDFFAHQDADDFSSPTRLEEQINFLQNHPEIAACGTGIDEIYKSDSDAPHIPSEFAASFNESDSYYHRKNLYAPFLEKGTCFQDSIEKLSHLKIAMNGSILFRKSALEYLGGFDGRTRVAGDTDLLWRLLIHFNFANLQPVLYTRRFHSGSLTQSPTVGFASAHRVGYMEKAYQRLQGMKEDFDNGNTENLRKRTLEDMFCPAVKVQVYDVETLAYKS